MGTDIHAIVQQKIGNKWKTIMRPNLPRNYLLFAVLADVRNGFGFAGLPTFTPIRPISVPRGWPHDFNPLREGEFYFGDHSESYLTFSEINSYSLSQTIEQSGYISPEQAISHRPGTRPFSFCRGTNNPNYVHVTWKETVRSQLKDTFIFLLVDAFSRANANLSDYRLVFNFDS